MPRNETRSLATADPMGRGAAFFFSTIAGSPASKQPAGGDAPNHHECPERGLVPDFSGHQRPRGAGIAGGGTIDMDSTCLFGISPEVGRR